MRIISVNPADPREDRLTEAIAALSAGGIVALPTETSYGLAVDAFAPEALVRVNRLKGKAANAPILLLLADRGQLGQVAAPPPELFEPLAERFWPGPLTLVVPRSARLPDEVTGGGNTVAVRVPGLALPRRVAAGLGRPISGVSANKTGELACRSAADVHQVFGEDIDVIVDGGPTPGGAPSTIVDLSGARPRILREGILPASALRPFLGSSDDPL